MPRTAAVFLIAAVAIPLILYFSGSTTQYSALRSQGVKTSGTVSVESCGKHTEFRYTFMAQGRSYSGVGGANPDECPNLKEGTAVSVVWSISQAMQIWRIGVQLWQSP